MAKYSSGWFRLHNQHVGFARTFAPRTSSLVVAPFSDGLMDAAPEGPLQDEIEAEADSQLEAGNEPADLRHTEGNWQKFSGSGAPFSALILTRITARKASAKAKRGNKCCIFPSR